MSNDLSPLPGYPRKFPLSPHNLPLHDLIIFKMSDYFIAGYMNGEFLIVTCFYFTVIINLNLIYR